MSSCNSDNDNTSQCDEKIFLHIKNDDIYLILDFVYDEGEYYFKETEYVVNKMPRMIDRILLSRNIIEYIMEQQCVYYKLNKRDIKLSEFQTNIFTCKSENKLTELEILENHDPMDSASTISHISYRSRNKVIKSSKLDQTDNLITEIEQEPILERLIKPYVSIPSRVSELSSSTTSTGVTTPTKSIRDKSVSSTVSSIYSTPTDTMTKRKDILSPEDYMQRSANIKKVRKSFTFTEYIDDRHDRQNRSKDYVKLFANQEGSDVHVHEENSFKLTAFKTYKLIKEVHKDKVEQTKFIIKGLFYIDKCMLSERTGTLIISNIKIEDFIKQIAPVLVLM